MIFFLHFFEIQSSSRHEEHCQILQTLFSVFQYSGNTGRRVKRFVIKSLQTGFDLVEDDDTYDLITEWQQHKREAKMCRTASLKSRLLQGSKMFKSSINK